MNWLCAAVASTALVVCVATAQGQELSDTFLRATYCVGVIDGTAEVIRKQALEARCQAVGAKSPTNTKVPGISFFGGETDSSPELERCRTEALAARATMAALVGDYADRRQRYARYVALRMLEKQPGTNQEIVNQQFATTTQLAVMLKGKRDAESLSQIVSSPAAEQCLKQQSMALIDCIAREDAALANVLRCLHGPDGLPF